MLRKGERGRAESLHRVARVAAVEYRRMLKLAGVHITVTIGTTCELDLEQRGFAGGDVALCALQCRVFSFEWICGLRMIGDLELRRLPSLDRMARRALAAIGAFGELSGVRIGTVAIGALCECDWPLEISGYVAKGAVYRRVLPKERELRRAMVELAAEGHR